MNIYKIVDGFINTIYFKRKQQIIHYLQNRRRIINNAHLQFPQNIYTHLVKMVEKFL